MTFARLLAACLRRAGSTKRDFARAIGVPPYRLSHLLGGAPPTVEVCLRVAVVAEISASTALRAAGKSTIADLLDTIYQPEGRHPSPRERDLLAAIRTLDPRTRKTILRAMGTR